MKDNYSDHWENVKKKLESIYPQEDLNIFINKVNFYKFDQSSNIMQLEVPSNFIKDHMKKYKTAIESNITKAIGNKCLVEFVILQKHSKESVKKEEDKKKDLKETKDIKETAVKKILSNKTDDYSFDSFVIGNSNEFAAKAARAVADNPGSQYNPYFIWGDSGLGKTHLLKAIEKHVKEHFPSKKVKYVTSEEFTNDFVNSLRSNCQEQFRLKYRKLDVLLLDDVQFFANKEGIQGEFFNTFNKLYDNFKQMVFSCDQPITKVKKMEERLKSRFGMGLVVDLRPPDFELRMAILKNLSESSSLKINFDAMEYICSNISGSIRDLKGAFQILQAYSSIMKKAVDLETVKEQLKERIIGSHTSPISVDKIIQFVAEYFNLKAHEVIGVKKTKSIALARQIAMYISRKITRLSTTQIGKYFGDKEHGTVMHATKRVEDIITKDNKLKNDIDLIINNLQIE